MATLSTKAPSGWKKWLRPATYIQGMQMPDASFPWQYTPSKNFWLKSYVERCDIEWYTTPDPMSLFMLSGGTSGTLTGSISALSVVNRLYDMTFDSATFSIFGSAPGPRFGYCVGGELKQQVYVRFDIQNVPNAVNLMYSGIELLENSKLKRIYVKEGEIQDVKLIDERYYLGLGIDKSTPPPFSAVGQITVYSSKTGTSTNYAIGEITDNWEIVVAISAEAEDVPQVGDYYELDTPWCIEDPYLLAGFWNGTENKIDSSDANTDATDQNFTSGYDLFVTAHNKPYLEEYFTGVYIWKKEAGTKASADLPEIYQPVSSKDMSDESGYEWIFLGFENSAEQSDTYKNDTRYKEERVIDTSVTTTTTSTPGTGQEESPAPAYITTYTPRTEGTNSDLEKLLALKPTYVRMEIGKGGNLSRHNWFAPALKGLYLVQNEKKFKIVSHITADIIDVSYISVDGKSELSIDGSQSNYILNQNAWMITEDYYETLQGARLGALEGTVSSITNESASISLKTPTSVATGKKGGLSMIDRYTKEAQMPSSITKMFLKGSGWRLVNRNDAMYLIDSVEFGTGSVNGPSQMTVTFSDSSKKNIAVKSDVWIDFFDPPTPYGSWKTKGPYSLEFEAYSANDGESTGYVTSNKLCISGVYQSMPYDLNINSNTRIGVCANNYFGLTTTGVLMFVTVKSTGRGIASLFSLLTREGFVFYQDPDTNRVTARIGSLDFKESPRKEEIVIGKTKSADIETASVSGSEIALDSKKERLKRISIEVPTFNGSAEGGIAPSLIFSIGSLENTYGFLVSGDGALDLQMLRYQGYARGELPSTTYVDEDGKSVSPVYVYKQSSLQNQKYADVSIGTDTTKSIFVKEGDKSGTPSSLTGKVKIHYVNNKQTLEINGFFDAVKISDGEIYFLYGKTTPAFQMESSGENNSGDTQWSNSNAVYVIGSQNDAYEWTTPQKFKNLQNQNNALVDENKYQYPVMVLNSVEYLACLYNESSYKLVIFVKAFSGNSTYVGCFSISIMSLTHKLYKCTSDDLLSLDFFYRPPLMKTSFIEDDTKSWINGASDVVDCEYDYEKSSKGQVPDTYIRIIGPADTKSVITADGDFSIISAFILPDGTYVLLYDSQLGVKVLYSACQGGTWIASDTILARGAKNAIVVGDCLIYITSDGIRAKRVYSQDFMSNASIMLKKAEGKSSESLEIGEQDKWDMMTEYTISTGAIESQRLSGYLSSDNQYRIFCYDENNRLKCYGSDNSVTWNVQDNF